MGTKEAFIGNEVKTYRTDDVYATDGVVLEAFRGEQIHLNQKATEDVHAVRFDQLADAIATAEGALVPKTVLVANLLVPTELNTVTPDFAGQLLLTYVTTPVQSTSSAALYVAVPKASLLLGTPFVMASGSASLYWLGIAGDIIGVSPAIQSSLTVGGAVSIGTAPSINTHAVRLQDLQTKVVKIVSVVSLTNPAAELNALSGDYEGQLLLAYPTGASSNQNVLYVYRNIESTTASAPSRIASSTGNYYWVAIGGIFGDSSLSVAGSLLAASATSDLFAGRNAYTVGAIFADYLLAGTAGLGVGDPTVNNSWRFLYASGNLLLQKRISGSWTTILTFTQTGLANVGTTTFTAAKASVDVALGVGETRKNGVLDCNSLVMTIPNQGIVLPRAGSVVSITISCDTSPAGGDGNAYAGVLLNPSLVTNTPAFTVALDNNLANQTVYVTQAAGIGTFSAGDLLFPVVGLTGIAESDEVVFTNVIITVEVQYT